jgi:hypothetical protein
MESNDGLIGALTWSGLNLVPSKEPVPGACELSGFRLWLMEVVVNGFGGFVVYDGGEGFGGCVLDVAE